MSVRTSSIRGREADVITSNDGSWAPVGPRGRPGSVAISASGVRTTYADLAARVTALRNAFTQVGVRRGDRIAYLGPTTTHAIETFYASLALGASHVPLDPDMSPVMITTIAEDTSMIAVVVDPAHHDHIALLSRRQIVLTSGPIPVALCEPLDYEAFLATGTVHGHERSPSPGDPGVLMPAHPTGAAPVAFDHGMVAHNVSEMATMLDIDERDSILVATHAHTHPWSGWLGAAALSRGAHLLITGSTSVAGVLDDLIDGRSAVTALRADTLRAMTACSRWASPGWVGPRRILCVDHPDEHLVRAWSERGTELVDVTRGMPSPVAALDDPPLRGVAC
ncbi:AMP-binding protein [Williamsia sp. MIQD14]|uniref:AMP-binding protein n=1 Tax=Williamsia sp. MIQD14 TaxID=3425703 RepID=UPI003DA0D45B